MFRPRPREGATSVAPRPAGAEHVSIRAPVRGRLTDNLGNTRACGGHVSDFPLDVVIAGSSPRMRGTRQLSWHPRPHVPGALPVAVALRQTLVVFRHAKCGAALVPDAMRV
jgi:hypothetical protein